MAAKHVSGARTGVQRAAVLLSAGALVAALNFTGIGAPQAAFTATDAFDRHVSASRSLPDRLDVQPGITVQDTSDPFFRIATGEAEAAKVITGDAKDGPVCISSPLPPGTFRISSNYGMRSNPITGGRGLHAGVDLAAAFGTPIHAVAAGTVSYTGAGRAGRSSELVIIDHEVDGTKFSSWYVHMYPEGVFVEAGQEVRAGEVIAEVGSNGFSTGPHLHLEIHTSVAVAGGKGAALGRILDAGKVPSSTEDGPATPTPSPSSSSTPPPDPSEGDQAGQSDTPDGEQGTSEEPTGEETEQEQPDQEAGQQEPAPEEAPEPGPTPESGSGKGEVVEDIKIEEDDDGGKNSHTIDDTVSRSTGVFDPSSLGLLHDPLPFLRELGYGIAPPSSCTGP